MKQEARQIRLLAPEVSNQIAAGEVVERPASVLKELVENSLDAEATQIDVTLENGGQTLVRIQDNGCGIDSDQLELAITRHATSKLTALCDLETIASYGFRGEALPSIASVSHFRIVSAGSEERKSGKMPEGIGTALEVDHGKIMGKRAVPLTCGTLVEVRDLFSQLPVRLKFLKNPASEQKRCQQWLARLALAHTEIGFTLTAGERRILNFTRTQDLRQRLMQIWPLDLADEMLPFDTRIHGMRAYGLAAPPHLRLSRPDRMYFYVNGRAVNDKRLLAAVREAYKGRIISKEYPQIVLFLELDPAEIDVNAHPAKTEVRFRNDNVVFSAIFAGLGRCFQASSVMTANPESVWENSHVYEPEERIMPLPPRKAACSGAWEASKNFENYTAFSMPADNNFSKEREKYQLVSYNGASLEETSIRYGSGPFPGKSAVVAENHGRVAPKAEFVFLGQILNTYLVLKDQNDNLALLDQHAAHERIIYEKLRSEKRASPSQLLLIPLVMALNVEEMERISLLEKNLRAFGFDLLLEKNTLTVKSIPEFFSRSDSRNFLEEVLREQRNTPEELFITAACRAAIKAGQKLSVDEAMELLKQWQAIPNAEFCPHGRPAVLRWDGTALEKLFKRRA